MRARSIIPVILCGGAGHRLWPLSTAEKPKPFHRISSAFSLLQETLLRCKIPLLACCPVVVAAASHHDLVLAQASEIGLKVDLVLESRGRDTMAAALAGVLRAQEREPDCLALILAADHHIPQRSAFAFAVKSAMDAAIHGRIVTFGVNPDGPVECYGYIGPGQKMDGQALFEIGSFIEKPVTQLAAQLICQGYLWNSGNFLCKAEVLLAEAAKYCFNVHDLIGKTFADKVSCGKALLLPDRSSDSVDAISIDRAIMQKTRIGSVLATDMEWWDLGSWNAVAKLYRHRKSGSTSDYLPPFQDNCTAIKFHELSASKEMLYFGASRQPRLFLVIGGHGIVEANGEAHDLGSMQPYKVAAFVVSKVTRIGLETLGMVEILLD